MLQIRDLADTGQKIVIQGVTNARASQALFGRSPPSSAPRACIEVLNDPKLLELYRAQDERLSQTREQLHRQAAPPRRATTLERARQLQQNIRPP